MRPCGHLTGIGTEVLITCRTGCRNIENLILDILIAGCIFQTNTIVEEVQVCTKLPVHGVLWLQIRVILHVVRYIRTYAIHWIANWCKTIHTATIAWHIIVVAIIVTSLTYMSERCTKLTIRKDVIILQSWKLCENPTE